MKKLVAAALTAVTAVIAGSAIALTPIHAQEIPPGEEAQETTAPPASGGTNLVVFVVPAGLGEVTDAACSLNGVAQESRAKPAMRVGGRAWLGDSTGDSTREWPLAGGGPSRQQAQETDDDVGLPDEACSILRGLFVSLGGQAPQFEATEVGPDAADDDDEAEDRSTPSDDENDADEEEGAEERGSLTPVSGSTAIFVTIFAGGDAGTDGCTLGELVGMSGASVPVVEAGGEEPLQGAADIADVALPADACALLSALFSTLANPPADDDVSVPEDDDAPEMDDDDATPSSGGAATDDDEAEADDEDSTPQATATPRATGTPTATSTPSATATTRSATATPSPTSTPDSSENEDSSTTDEDEEPLGDEEPGEAAP